MVSGGGERGDKVLAVLTPEEPAAPAVVPQEPGVASLLVVPPVVVPPPVAVPLPLANPPTATPPTPPAAAKHRAMLPKLPTEQRIVYGYSGRGRPLTGWVLDNGGMTGDTTLILGGFHGNERATPGLVEHLHRYLKARPQSWPGRRVLLVPVANPDGWAAGTRVDGDGVDINRNFPVGWSCTGAARNNPGPAAASEAETRAIMRLLKTFRPSKVLSLHSPLRCLNWTGQTGLEIARAMSADDHLPVRAYIGYPTPGSLGDYCGAIGVGIVTVELPEEGVNAAWQQNRAALLTAIRFPPLPQSQPYGLQARRESSHGSLWQKRSARGLSL